MKKYLVFLLFFIYPIYGDFTGQVFDQEKRPITGVLVFWEENEISTYTKKNGMFRIRNVDQAGIYFFDFRKSGYQSKVVTIELSKGVDKSIIVTLNKLKTMRAVQVKRKNLQSLTERKGVSSTIVDTDTIRKIKLNKFDDLSALSANLFNMGTGSSFLSSFSLRGMGGGSPIDPVLALYIDGIAQFQSYIFPTLLVNTDSIEILKGPQTTSFGRNSTSGVIDIKTKIPPNRFSIATSVEIGSGFDLNLDNQTYDLYFTAPLIKDQLYFKGGGYYHQFEGFFYNETLKKYTGGENNFSTYFRFDNFNKYFDLIIRTKYERLTENSLPYHNSIESAHIEPYKIDHDRAGKNQKDIIDNYIKFAIPFYGFDIDFNFTFQYLTGFMDIDLDFTKNNISTLDIDLSHYQVTSESKILSTSESEEYFSWSMGSYLYYQYREIETKLADNLSNEITQVDSTDDIIGGALFASLTIPIFEDFFLIVGARGDIDYRKIDINKYLINKDGKTSVPNKAIAETLIIPIPKLSINYYPIPDILIYLTGTRGYKSGGLNLYTTQLEKKYYEPEYSWNVDLGIKSKFLIDNKIGNVDISFFYTSWKNQHVNVYLPNENNLFEFGVVNSSSSYSLGAEFESKIPVYWGFSTGINYGYVYSKYLNFEIENKNVNGNFQTFIPKNTFSSFIEHEFKFELLSIRDALINRFDLKYISDYYFDVENNYSQGGYYILNYTFNLNISGFLWTFWVKNIMDNRYFDFGLPSDDSLRVKVGDPLSLGGKFSFYF